MRWLQRSHTGHPLAWCSPESGVNGGVSDCFHNALGSAQGEAILRNAGVPVRHWMYHRAVPNIQCLLLVVWCGPLREVVGGGGTSDDLLSVSCCCVLVLGGG